MQVFKEEFMILNFKFSVLNLRSLKYKSKFSWFTFIKLNSEGLMLLKDNIRNIT